MERVGITLGVTVNLPGYQSARIDVYNERECTAEDRDAVYGLAMEWCRVKLQEEVSKIYAEATQRCSVEDSPRNSQGHSSCQPPIDQTGDGQV